MTLSFKRNIWTRLIEWKEQKTKKPLILRGARQVGKTTILRELGSTYKHFIEINLEKKTQQKLIQKSDGAEELVRRLSLMYKIPSSEWSETLLFIDEIQEDPKAIGFLRYFYEDIPQLDVVAAGSLLEHSFSHTKSFPVGRVNYIYLSPLNFQEFLLATNNQELKDFLDHIPIDKIAHPILLNLFHTYCIIGGMPEVIATYVSKGDITHLLPIYESIWHTYKDDIRKYAKNSSEEKIIKHLVNTASAYVDKRIKFQNFGQSNYKSREVSEAFSNIDQTQLIQIIHPSTVLEPPIVPNYKKSPRLQFLDTGLLNFDLDIQGQLLSMSDLGSAYHGAIIPHMITQELISIQEANFKKPSFWVRDKTQSSAEVDLIRVNGALLIPIEIKSGATGTLKSLHQFIDEVPHHLAVRFYAGSFKIETSKTRKGKAFYLMNLPYYLGSYLDKYLSWFVEGYASKKI